MRPFKVKVKTMTGTVYFEELGFASAAIAAAVSARFGGLCAVTVVPA